MSRVVGGDQQLRVVGDDERCPCDVEVDESW
jgi:hypothetical protein